MNKLVFLIFIVTAFAFTSRDSAINSTSVILTPESSLIVKGTTNVNTFSCAYNIYKFKNPIQIFYKIEDSKMKFNKTALVLDNDCFNCGGKAINNDFQSILKSDKYPQIILLLKEISSYGNVDAQAFIDIQIAGVTNAYKIPVKLKKGNNILVTGDLNLNLTDFNIHPPKKFLGLIVVDDKIDIYFQLAIRENN